MRTSSAVTASMRVGPGGDVVQREARRQRRAVPIGERHLAVARVDRLGDEPVLGAGQRGLVEADRGHAGHDGLDRRVELVEAHPFRRHRVEVEARLVERGAHVMRAGADGDLVLHDQRLEEHARLPAAEQEGEHFERLRLARRAGAVGRHEVQALEARLLDLLVGERDLAVRRRAGLLRAQALRRRAERRHRAVDLLGKVERRLRLDVAGDDEDRVLRRVEALVVAERVGAIEPLDLVRPADHRLAVGVRGVERGLHRLVEDLAGVGIGAHAALLLHHVALGRDDLVGEHEILHPVRLVFHADREVLLGDALEIGGEIVGRESVLLAAEVRHQLGELARRVLVGALEHQVLEEVGDARLADRVVGRAVAVPHHVRADRRAVIGDHHDPPCRCRACPGRSRCQRPCAQRRRRPWPPRGSGRKRRAAWTSRHAWEHPSRGPRMPPPDTPIQPDRQI